MGVGRGLVLVKVGCVEDSVGQSNGFGICVEDDAHYVCYSGN